MPCCRTECALCKQPYLMQAVDDPMRTQFNKLPRWAVPLEMIEWQPSYTQAVSCRPLLFCTHSLHVCRTTQKGGWMDFMCKWVCTA